ncbi:MAG: hypothetical protein ACRDJH_24555 [Thermomicrobiales bacterium]
MIATDRIDENEIIDVMRDLGMNRVDAERFIIERRMDLTNDIVFIPSLSEEERQKIGFGKTLRKVMAELGELDDAAG